MDLSVDEAIRLTQALKAAGVAQFKFGEFAVAFLPGEVSTPSLEDLLPSPDDEDEESILFHSAGGR